MLIKLNGLTHMLSPVFHCPNNPKNTFSPGALKLFSGFKRAMEDMHTAIYFQDNKNTSFSLPCQIYNSLDYITVEVMSCKANHLHSTINAVTRSQSSIASKNHSNAIIVASPLASIHPSKAIHKHIFLQLPTNIIANIASFIMDYVPKRHPEETTLTKLYDLFHMRYRPDFTTINHISIANCQSTMDKDIIYPVIDKLYRTKKPTYTS